MSNITFSEFQTACLRTANPNLTNKECHLNWALGLAGEAGEYCEIIKKHYFHKKGLNKDHIKSELGDILYYLAAAASEHGMKLEDIAQCNVEKLSKRYKDGFVNGGGDR